MKRTRKLRFTLLGTLVGAALGVWLLFLPDESIPSVVQVTVLAISGLVRRVMFSDRDPMVAFAIAIPVYVVLFATLGALVGSVLSILLKKKNV